MSAAPRPSLGPIATGQPAGGGRIERGSKMRKFFAMWAGMMSSYRVGLCKDMGFLVLRVGFAATLLTHGWAKFSGYSGMAETFPDPVGVGSRAGLALVILAEFFCPLLIILGLATRLATIPVIITMTVAFAIVHGADPFKVKELALLYLMAYAVILVGGAGRFSVDGCLMKKYAPGAGHAKPPVAGY